MKPRMPNFPDVSLLLSQSRIIRSPDLPASVYRSTVSKTRIPVDPRKPPGLGSRAQPRGRETQPNMLLRQIDWRSKAPALVHKTAAPTARHPEMPHRQKTTVSRKSGLADPNPSPLQSLLDAAAHKDYSMFDKPFGTRFAELRTVIASPVAPATPQATNPLLLGAKRFMALHRIDKLDPRIMDVFYKKLGLDSGGDTELPLAELTALCLDVVGTYRREVARLKRVEDPAVIHLERRLLEQNHGNVSPLRKSLAALAKNPWPEADGSPGAVFARNSVQREA